MPQAANLLLSSVASPWGAEGQSFNASALEMVLTVLRWRVPPYSYINRIIYILPSMRLSTLTSCNACWDTDPGSQQIRRLTVPSVAIDAGDDSLGQPATGQSFATMAEAVDAIAQ